MFKRWKEKIYTTAFAAGVAKGREDEREALRAKRRREEHQCVKKFLDKPVIMIGNEWTDPIIGIGLRMAAVSKAEAPMLVVHDYISGKEYLGSGILMDFTTQKFDALLKLSPVERYAILANNAVADNTHTRDFQPKLLTAVEIQARLIASGFFKEVNKR